MYYLCPMYVHKVELKFVRLDRVIHIAESLNKDECIGVIMDARVFLKDSNVEYLVTFSAQDTYWLREDEIIKINQE